VGAGQKFVCKIRIKKPINFPFFFLKKISTEAINKEEDDGTSSKHGRDDEQIKILSSHS
jgi:hypothetical protein